VVKVTKFKDYKAPRISSEFFDCPLPFQMDQYGYCGFSLGSQIGNQRGCQYCVPAGTKILMSDKTEKNIEELKVGEKILGWSISLKKLRPNQILKTFEREDYLTKIKLENGENLLITEEHPVFVKNKGWVKIKDLKVGDEVLVFDGKEEFPSSYLSKNFHIDRFQISKRMKENNPMKNKEIVKKMLETKKLRKTGKNFKWSVDDERKFKLINRMLINNPAKNEEFRKRISEIQRHTKKWAEGKGQTEKFKALIKKGWETRRIRGTDRGWSLSEETRQRHRELAKKMWCSELAKKLLCPRKPTSLEKRLIKIMDKFGLPYKYVGNGKFFIERINPDFINRNGKKKVIEVFSTYIKTQNYGSLENYVNNRNSIFKKYGFSCLYLPDDEINRMRDEQIAELIKRFDENEMGKS
jgi:hypothetical protein